MRRILTTHADPDERPRAEGVSPFRLQLKDDLADIAASITGATVFVMSVAATGEITMLPARLGPLQLLLLIAASLAMGYVILFAAGFHEREVPAPSVFQSSLAEVLLTYSVSAVVSLLLLYLVGDPQTFDSFDSVLASTVVLALPASVGGAAGRLIV
jgi:uncharacterized membrane protein